MTVELDLLFLTQPIPIDGAVNVDEPVRQNAPVRIQALAPVDVARGVPLVALRLLVEAAHVLVCDLKAVIEHRWRSGVDSMGVGRCGWHGQLLKCY